MTESFTAPLADRHSRPSVVVAVLASAGIVVSLMQTLVIPIVPELPRYLDAPASDTAWAVTATLLASSIAVPVTGRLGDMFGKRRLILIGLALMVAGSLLGAVSSSLIPLIAGRVLQGFAAGVIPLGISVMRDVVPKEKLAGAIALMGASLGVGGALGLPMAAVIAEYTHWHVLFWASAALGALAFVLVVALVPESTIRSGGTFDYLGAMLLSLGLIALLLAISKGADWGWTSKAIVSLVATSMVAFLAWGHWESRVEQPLVDLRISIRRQVLLTNSASLLFGFSMFVVTLVFPRVVQNPESTGFGGDGSLLVAGLVLAPFGTSMMIVAPVSSRITNRRGPRATLMLGAVTVAVGYLTGVFLMHSIWQLVVVATIIGAGTGLAFGAMPALIMAAVPPQETGAAIGFNTVTRSMGASCASALIGVILSQMTISSGAAPSEAGFRLAMALAAAAALAALLISIALRPFEGRTAALPSASVGRKIGFRTSADRVPGGEGIA